MRITNTRQGKNCCFRLAKSAQVLSSLQRKNDLTAYPWEIYVIQRLISAALLSLQQKAISKQPAFFAKFYHFSVFPTPE